MNYNILDCNFHILNGIFLYSFDVILKNYICFIDISFTEFLTPQPELVHEKEVEHLQLRLVTLEGEGLP